MKFIDFFSGIGGFRRGLELAGHECVGFCEIDKYAVMSYISMHLLTDEQRVYLSTLDLKERQKEILKDEYRNGEWYSNDIKSVLGRGDLPRADIWCFGFPCQDISIAGRGLGFNGVRSSLFFTVTDIIKHLPEEDRPKYLFIENVKNLLSVNRGFDFAKLLIELDEIGYDAEWQLLNSKNFGVPQNRERVFIIGHLRERSGPQIFPIETANGSNSISMIGHRKGYMNNLQTFDPEGISGTIDTAGGGGRENHIAIINKEYKHQHEQIHDQEGIASTICARDYKDPQRIAVPIKNANKQGYDLAGEGDSINLQRPTSDTRRGRVGHGVAQTLDTECAQGTPIVIGGLGEKTSNDGQQWFQQDRVYDSDEVATSLSAKLPGGANMYDVPPQDDIETIYYPKKDCYIAIRKLTPKECFRLQGWTDDYFEKAQFVNSDSQLYKQAGNGVTVNVIEEIGRRMK